MTGANGTLFEARPLSSPSKSRRPGRPDASLDPGCTSLVASATMKAMLQCSSKHWKPVEKCLGQNGCVANVQGAKCDNSTSEVGAPCQKEDTYACSVDKKTLLRCTSGKLVAHASCPGMHNCRKQFDRIECNGETPLKK